MIGMLNGGEVHKTIVFLLLAIPQIHAADLPDSENNPEAAEPATIVHGNARFTVLTPRVVRMEWSPERIFEDRSSLTVVNRRLPVPGFTATRRAGSLTITTDALTLIHRDSTAPFSGTTLHISFHTGALTGDWQPGQANSGNLLGTLRTLDGMDGDLRVKDSTHFALEPGILSRDGWVVIDDSARPVFDQSEWPWVTARTAKPHQDMYFLAYGRNYRTALRDFVAIAGKIALPPRFAFGYWYSRWRASSDMEFRELVGTFDDLDIPLDVLVLDMDWHITSLPEFFDGDQRKKDQAGEDCGWTGFTWNRSYFPDPAAFLQWTDRKGLKTCLNLHPASGFQPHEEQYESMARAMGIDPSTKKYVPFSIVDKQFAENYFARVLHPMEQQGVDFWWLDWQQWHTTPIPGVNPTFYLNYVHYTDMERRKDRRRPLIYHRWGGLGNHRYQIGFSGDTRISWNSLAFQPYFTATAANVGFGYWGNDIGGFFGDPNTPEQFTRWFQFGVFSPILKTHATGRNFSILRRIWEYPPATFLQLRDLIRLRYSLLPYIYTAARYAYDSGVSICRPLYYDHPTLEEAYAHRNEYYFGDNLLVHPVTHAAGTDSLFTWQQTWLPPGSWFEWSSGTLITGDTLIRRPFRIEDIPVYVTSGAILPMQHPAHRAGEALVDPLVFSIFPGSSGSTRVYEDDGTTSGFKQGEHAATPASFRRNGDQLTVTIGAVEGAYAGMPQDRYYELRFPHSPPPVSVLVNGRSLAHSPDASGPSWNYDGHQLTTEIRLPSSSVRRSMTVTVRFPPVRTILLEGKKRQMDILYRFSQFLSDQRNFRRQNLWNDARYSSDLVMHAAQTGLRMSQHPERALQELEIFEKEWKQIVAMVTGLASTHPIYLRYSELMHIAG